MMDSSTFKRFTASIENILENLEDMDFTAFGNTSEIFKMLAPIRNPRSIKKIVLVFLNFLHGDLITHDTCLGHAGFMASTVSGGLYLSNFTCHCLKKILLLSAESKQGINHNE